MLVGFVCFIVFGLVLHVLLLDLLCVLFAGLFVFVLYLYFGVYLFGVLCCDWWFDAWFCFSDLLSFALGCLTSV